VKASLKKKEPNQAQKYVFVIMHKRKIVLRFCQIMLWFFQNQKSKNRATILADSQTSILRHFQHFSTLTIN